jgi:hypothetical protein
MPCVRDYTPAPRCTIRPVALIRSSRASREAYRYLNLWLLAGCPPAGEPVSSPTFSARALPRGGTSNGRGHRQRDSPRVRGAWVRAESDEAQEHKHSNLTFKFLGLALVGMLGVLASQSLWKGRSPAAAALVLRDSDTSKRIAAISDLERFGAEEPGVALPALCKSLNDEDAKRADELATQSPGE